VQRTKSGPQAHLGRGNELAGVLTLWCPTQLSTFCLAAEAMSFISRSLAAQGPEKTFTEKRDSHSDPLRGVARGLRTTIT
jgi:hypothetical protein